jgi:hypothetical protein
MRPATYLKFYSVIWVPCHNADASATLSLQLTHEAAGQQLTVALGCTDSGHCCTAITVKAAVPAAYAYACTIASYPPLSPRVRKSVLLRQAVLLLGCIRARRFV